MSVDNGIVLIDTLDCATIPDEVLCTGRNLVSAKKKCVLLSIILCMNKTIYSVKEHYILLSAKIRGAQPVTSRDLSL